MEKIELIELEINEINKLSHKLSNLDFLERGRGSLDEEIQEVLTTTHKSLAKVVEDLANFCNDSDLTEEIDICLSTEPMKYILGTNE